MKFSTVAGAAALVVVLCIPSPPAVALAGGFGKLTGMLGKTKDMGEINETQEIEIGSGIASTLLGAAPLVKDKAVQEYVNKVGLWLALQTERPNLPWHFGVLDSPTVNAFSAPGGYVFVTTGLLKLIDNEAQLAGVLGHEIGHISGRHALKSYSAVKYSQCDAATTGGSMLAKGLDMAPELRRAAAYAKFFSGGNFDLDSKDMAAGLIASLADGFIDSFISEGLAAPDELEADKYAIELSTFAGYDAAEYEKFLQKLPASGDNHHPPLAERSKAIHAVRSELAAFSAKGVKPDNAAQLKVVKK